MNAPPRHEMFVLPDGVKKVTITKDTKMPNCMDFEIQKEDHTISNPLRVKLLENPKVLFAGYKAPHPLEYRTIVKIQTTPDTTPIIAMQNAIQELVVEFGSIRSKFEIEAVRAKPAAAGAGARGVEGQGAQYGQAGMDAGRGGYSASGVGLGSGMDNVDVDLDF